MEPHSALTPFANLKLFNEGSAAAFPETHRIVTSSPRRRRSLSDEAGYMYALTA
ncbi:hypothetical protein PC116_g17035 [Phytophthora cactorum]|uniref:Uncharacterized protein n=1 Tax=Phytophthora cactorum TaxID=29920 RepID=A0A8T1CYT4_9STRA|nr:hypothetical protein PC114_g14070 [Phytophthora cactorum]KAG2930567.1 hypothetical protein PC117_g13691 [Phytophthora cactorum]KAG3002640.1 hypothetical protein PC119_g16253 [Phytophthora cactorum]KAG3007766.1 hypothetical protein PC120_g16634 [Phytophthora cactorum]KAG3174634.1 hypothetical protein PC128_g17991 [Phytophthora cactorum]